MAWVETSSAHFTARHDDRDAEDASEVLDLLEQAREELSELLEPPGEEIAAVIHSNFAALSLSQPILPVVRAIAAPASRRYLAGWPGTAEIHLLAPRVLASRASSVPGSLEMLLLAPAALYAQLACGRLNPALPPPLRPRSALATARNAWIVAGCGQWLSGQTAHARPAIARRLKEGGRPAFPPSASDALLLGGSVFDLLATEQGSEAAVRLAVTAPADDPRETVARAFPGRSVTDTEGVWRSHLARLAGA
ncbi:MAG: hypothetical protein FGM34_00690 [Solirubrobacteraceae bacterium]|nr:hypothetical protein [Solirubrobacteraceae bacterium]